MRSYETARSLFSFLAFCAWSVVVIGGIVALIGLGSVSSYAGGAAGLLAAVPGFGIALAGLLLVAFVQIGRANVDTAEYTQQMLQIARDQLEVSKQGLKQGQTPKTSFSDVEQTPSDATQSNTADYADIPANDTADVAQVIENPSHKELSDMGTALEYKGQTIIEKDGSFIVGDVSHRSLVYAQKRIDRSQKSS